MDEPKVTPTVTPTPTPTTGTKKAEKTYAPITTGVFMEKGTKEPSASVMSFALSLYEHLNPKGTVGERANVYIERVTGEAGKKGQEWLVRIVSMEGKMDPNHVRATAKKRADFHGVGLKLVLAGDKVVTFKVKPSSTEEQGEARMNALQAEVAKGTKGYSTEMEEAVRKGVQTSPKMQKMIDELSKLHGPDRKPPIP